MTAEAESATVLLVDDDAAYLRALQQGLERDAAPEQFRFVTATNRADALTRAASDAPLAAVVDLTIDTAAGPSSGMSLIAALQERLPALRVIVLTGEDAAEVGIQALQHGASSFLQKPADTRHLAALLQDAVFCASLKQQYLNLVQTPLRIAELTGLQTQSANMLRTLEAVVYAAASNQPVLLSGETGTGKGVLAQAIHRASSRRAKPLIRFQPSFTGHDLTSSELFGHARGAFTGALADRKGLLEEAHQGTLFIDEVDQIPAETQVSLLNVLQEKTFRRLGTNRDLKSDFRLIAATNCPITGLVGPNRLREDFFHRIAHCIIEIPPLRDRKPDLPQLARSILDSLVDRESLPIQALTPEALQKLAAYDWPGNVRELQAVIEGGAFRAAYEQRPFIDIQDVKVGKTETAARHAGSFRERVDQFERKLIDEALALNDDNQTKAAESLQLDRSSFRRILNRT